MYQGLRLNRKGTALVAAAAIVFTMIGSFLLPRDASAAGCVSGTLIKGSMPAVYYCGADGKRYVFPNDKTYFTWYVNFNGIVTLSDADLGTITIGGNVTYKPGVMLVKIQSDPRTYAVGKGGVLRHIASESVATCLYGDTWNKMVHDLSDAFFVNYTLGTAVNVCADFNQAGEVSAATSINVDRGLSVGAGTAPTVTTVTPAENATAVPVSADIQIAFNEAMSSSTINAGTILVTKGSTQVNGTVTYTASGNVATFNPTANFDAGSTYTVRVTTGAKDSAGTGLASEFSWSFQTAAAY